jgi:hypothetical protein
VANGLGLLPGFGSALAGAAPTTQATRAKAALTRILVIAWRWIANDIRVFPFNMPELV